jgi:hypothetical protein
MAVIADEDAVRSAVLDYVAGWFEGDAGRMKRALPPELVRRCRGIENAHRLERYRAGRRMDYASASPSDIATAIAEEIGRDVDYRPVATDGAARAAAMLAELL